VRLGGVVDADRPRRLARRLGAGGDHRGDELAPRAGLGGAPGRVWAAPPGGFGRRPRAGLGGAPGRVWAAPPAAGATGGGW
jgi:hypothetical protein